MRIRLLSSLLIILLAGSISARRQIDDIPLRSEVIPDFEIEKFEQNISVTPDGNGLEGTWIVSDEEMIFCIEPIEIGSGLYPVEGYRMVLFNSPNKALPPGTVFGYVTPTAKADEYMASIYSQADGSTLILPKKYLLVMDTTGRSFEFRRQRGKISLEWWRLLPYMWRNPVRVNNTASPYRGAIRLYPRPLPPITPICL